MSTAARRPRNSARRPTPVLLTVELSRVTLAVLSEYAVREREDADAMRGGPATADAAADKRSFADLCDRAAAAVRAALDAVG